MNAPCLHLQGDASLHTPEAMEARIAVKSKQEFIDAVKEWWDWLPVNDLPALELGE